jgi:hypothetical protein
MEAFQHQRTADPPADADSAASRREKAGAGLRQRFCGNPWPDGRDTSASSVQSAELIEHSKGRNGMAIRYRKMALVVFIGLMALVYGLQNIVNLQAAHGVVAAVLGMAGHQYYPVSIGPAITSRSVAVPPCTRAANRAARPVPQFAGLAEPAQNRGEKRV